MKIAFINGSPRVKDSHSDLLLDELRALHLTDESENFSLVSSRIDDDTICRILECDAAVFAFPLYVDGIPSHLLTCLRRIEAFVRQHKPAQKAHIFAVVNCGFYEGIQCAPALELIKNWCIRASLVWIAGIGIGGGGMMPFLRNIPAGKGPKKNITAALNYLSTRMRDGSCTENRFVSPNFPRFLYKLFAEMGWRRQAKANGLKPRDLRRRIVYKD